MNIEFHLNEIRAAIATVSAGHAKGELTRADIICVVNFVEGCCDDIAKLAQAATPPVNFGTVQLPIMKLADVAAQMRAEDATRAAARSHLALVSSDGDAA